jgi:hypothetical protein
MIEARTGRDGARVHRARVYYRGRYVASRTFARKRDAQEWERRQVDGLRSGVWSDPGAANRPVRDWCDVWLAAQPPRAPATERKIREAIGKRIVQTFRRRPAISVRPSEVRAWSADLARTQSPATARRSLGVLRRVFDYAVQDGAIPRIPRQVSAYLRSTGMSPSRSRTLNSGSSQNNRSEEGPRPNRGCRMPADFVGASSRR